MANELLREAIRTAGLEPADLATLIQVDTKTVERWIAGRVPYPRYRHQVARALNLEEHQLWPTLASTDEPTGDLKDESQDRTTATVIEPNGTDPAVWHDALASAETQLDLLDLTLAHIIN